MNKKNTPKPEKNASPLAGLNVVLVAAVIILGGYIINSSMQSKNTSDTGAQPGKETVKDGGTSATTTPRISPTPYPITQGRYEYKFSWGAGTTVPKMMTLVVDPHDAGVGVKQTVQARFTHTTAISKVSMVLTTDTKKTTFPMSLTEGTATDGVWTGSWNIPEAHDFNYVLTPMVTVDGKEIPYKTVIRELPNE